MTEISAAQDLFNDIVNSRGGVDALSAEQQRIAHALTRALSVAPSEIEPVLIARLTQLLPPPSTPSISSDVDDDATVEAAERAALAVLTDEELATLAAIQGKIEGVPVPEIETTPAMKAARDAYQRVCDENAQLRKDRDGMHAHISRIARDNERLEKEIKTLRAVVPDVSPEPAPDPEPGPSGNNVTRFPSSGQRLINHER